MIRWSSLVPIVALAACGRIGFDSEIPPDEDCDWIDDLYIQGPEPLDELNSGAREGAPFITADGETLYFSSGDDFYLAERDGAGGRFSAPEYFDRLSNDDAADTGLSFAGDHLEVFFASDRDGPGSNLYRGRRPTLAAPILDQSPVSAVNTGDDEITPHLAQSDLALYFARRYDSDDADLYVSFRPDLDASFGAAEPLAELSSEQSDLSPSLTADGRVIVFSSARAGSLDLYVATRDSVGEPFGEPVALDGINTAGIDTDPFVTRDGCFLYFASDRGGGELDLYFSRAFR